MNPVLGRTAYAVAVAALGEHRVFRYLAQTRKVHGMTAAEITLRQSERLATLIDWVSRNNTWYARWLAAPRGRADAVATLQSMPLLDKYTLQTEAENIRTAGFRGRLIRKSTGGSTGTPVPIVKEADGIAREMATSWAALEWYGIGIGDRSVRFWGTPLTAQRRLRFRLTDLAMNRIRLSAFDLDAEDLASYWRRLLRFQPVWMYGYASLIHHFALWIEEQGHDGRRLGLRAIVPTSEPLSEAQRSTVAAVFGAPVYNEYGCGEVGAIAYACEEGRLHVMTENVVLECLDEDGRQVRPGETGELVVTDLTNHAMPLLRYRLGDRGVPGDGCSCGRGFPVLECVLGRVHDVVYTPAGRRWHGEKINYLMRQLYGEGVQFRQYQIVQQSQDQLQVRLVADAEIPSEAVLRIVQYIEERLDGMRAEVVRVERIERAPSGKIRLVRNDWLPQGVQPHT